MAPWLDGRTKPPLTLTVAVRDESKDVLLVTCPCRSSSAAFSETSQLRSPRLGLVTMSFSVGAEAVLAAAVTGTGGAEVGVRNTDAGRDERGLRGVVHDVFVAAHVQTRGGR